MNWTERVHRRAACLGLTVSGCRLPNMVRPPYPRRIEKVKFGFPLDQVCKNNIPGPLLVLILKLNKEAAYRKDVFRAPGHQTNIKQLVHFLQTGRLVNLDNFSIYTIASVLKKFLRKIPDGIFGAENEERLFQIIEMNDVETQRCSVHNLLASLPSHTQRLLVLLFGTFRVISAQAERARTGMTSEAIGVSTAPSFFLTCSQGCDARPSDVGKYKVAMRVMRFLIDSFGVSDVFGRENYEYYARITGRVLRVDRDWICCFRYPACVSQNMLSSLCRSSPGWLQLWRAEPADGDDVIGDEEESTAAGCQHPRLSASVASELQQAGEGCRRSGALETTDALGSLSRVNSPRRLVKCGSPHRGTGSHTTAADSPCRATQMERREERMRMRTQWFLAPAAVRRRSASGGGTGGGHTPPPSAAEVRAGPPTIHLTAGGGGERDDRAPVRRSSSVEQRPSTTAGKQHVQRRTLSTDHSIDTSAVARNPSAADAARPLKSYSDAEPGTDTSAVGASARHRHDNPPIPDASQHAVEARDPLEVTSPPLDIENPPLQILDPRLEAKAPPSENKDPEDDLTPDAHPHES